MRIILLISMLTLAGCAPAAPAVQHHHPKPKVLPHENWDKNYPERFDWEKYLAEHDSVSDQMFRAYYGIKVLEERMNYILASHRKRLASEPEQLALFNSAQAKWEEVADLETTFIANGWRGGSGYRAALPSAKLRLLLNRVKRLLDLKGEALDLNE